MSDAKSVPGARRSGSCFQVSEAASRLKDVAGVSDKLKTHEFVPHKRMYPGERSGNRTPACAHSRDGEAPYQKPCEAIGMGAGTRGAHARYEGLAFPGGYHSALERISMAAPKRRRRPSAFWNCGTIRRAGYFRFSRTALPTAPMAPQPHSFHNFSQFQTP
jgi:hypothetical protein